MGFLGKIFSKKGEEQSTVVPTGNKKQVINIESILEEIKDSMEKVDSGVFQNVSFEFEEDLRRIYAIKKDVFSLFYSILNELKSVAKTDSKIVVKADSFPCDKEFCKLHPSMVPGIYVRISFSCSNPEHDITKVYKDVTKTAHQKLQKGYHFDLVQAANMVRSYKGLMTFYGEEETNVVKFYFRALKNSVIKTVKKSESENYAEYIEEDFSNIFKGKTILLVDDDPVMIKLANGVLNGTGVNIIVAENGHAAIDAYRENINEIDLILLDVFLPDCDGPVAFENMKKMNPFLKVVFISGDDNNKDVKKLEKSHPEQIGFVSKPYSRSQIVNMMKRFIS